MNDFVFHDLRRTFGPPQKVLDNGEAGEIWVYSETWVKTNQGRMTVNNNTATWINPSTVKYDKYIKFWVDGNNVYRWESYGHNLKRMTVFGIIGILVGSFFLGYSVLGPALG